MRKTILLFFSSIITMILVSGCNRSGSSIIETKIVRDTVYINKLDDLNQELLSTYIFVRHAEKRKEDNPSLTENGIARSKELARMLSNVSVDAIFSTDYNRTIETAEPSASSKKLETKLYNPRDLEGFAEILLQNYKEKTVLIVGHSNTTPKLINVLLKEDKLKSLSEDQYDDIFILTISNENIKKLLPLKYGKIKS